MAAYPWWPAVVCQPSVNDRDIARKRLDGCLFVRFFGWTGKADHHFTGHASEVTSPAGPLMGDECPPHI